jgi:hypothetical protein
MRIRSARRQIDGAVGAADGALAGTEQALPGPAGKRIGHETLGGAVGAGRIARRETVAADADLPGDPDRNRIPARGE